MLFTHMSNFVHKNPKMAKHFRSFPHKIALGCIKIVVVCYQFIFIKSLTYQLSYLALEIFFECLVIPKVSIFFCVWSIWVFSAPLIQTFFTFAMIDLQIILSMVKPRFFVFPPYLGDFEKQWFGLYFFNNADFDLFR